MYKYVYLEEIKTSSEKVEFGKPKLYFNEKKSAEILVQKKVLGDSATLSKVKREEEYDEGYY